MLVVFLLITMLMTTITMAQRNGSQLLSNTTTTVNQNVCSGIKEPVFRGYYRKPIYPSQYAQDAKYFIFAFIGYIIVLADMYTVETFVDEDDDQLIHSVHSIHFELFLFKFKVSLTFTIPDYDDYL